jgi:hypothetical protein
MDAPRLLKVCVAGLYELALQALRQRYDLFGLWDARCGSGEGVFGLHGVCLQGYCYWSLTTATWVGPRRCGHYVIGGAPGAIQENWQREAGISRWTFLRMCA